jgi:nucleotide-binding universal stress UspA family protein
MKILAAIDLSEASAPVLSVVRRYAKLFSAQVWLLHVADPEPDFVGYAAGPQNVRDFAAGRYHREHRQLQRYADRLRKVGIAATALLVQGRTSDTILDQAEKLKVDLLVMGFHRRRALRKILAGSVSEAVLAKSARPILCVPTHGRTPRSRPARQVRS